MPFGFNGYSIYMAGGSLGFNTDNGDVYGVSLTGMANRWVHITTTRGHSRRGYDGIPTHPMKIAGSHKNLLDDLTGALEGR
jgi:hypothetical protein